MTPSFLYLSQMTDSEKPDDADAVVLSFQNVLKRCKGTNKNENNNFIPPTILPLLFLKDYLRICLDFTANKFYVRSCLDFISSLVEGRF